MSQSTYYLCESAAKARGLPAGSSAAVLDRGTGALAICRVEGDGGLREVGRSLLEPEVVRELEERLDACEGEGEGEGEGWVELTGVEWADLIDGLGPDEAFVEPDSEELETEETDFDGEVPLPLELLVAPEPQMLRDIADRRGWPPEEGAPRRRVLKVPLHLAYEDERWVHDPEADEGDLQMLVELEAEITANLLATAWPAWERFVLGYNPQLKHKPPPPSDVRRVAQLCERAHGVPPEVQELIPRAVRARLTHWLRTEPEKDLYVASLNELGRCRERIVLRNLRLASWTGHEVHHVGLGVHDRALHGVAGLIRAIDSYEPNGPANFATYARNWIRARVTRAATETGGPSRIPGNLAERRMKLARAIRAAVLHGEEDGIQTPSAERYPPARRADAEDLLSFLDVPSLGDASRLEPHWTSLERALGALSLRERNVVELRLGLNGGERKKLAEIGEMLDLSRERIRQIEKGAYRKVWDELKNELQPRPGNTRPMSSGSPTSSS